MITILKPRSLLLLALLALLAYMAVAIPKIADLPLTGHAIDGHKGQKWEAATIVSAMTGGNCGPVNVYLCPDDTYVYTCQDPDNAGRLLGLRVGVTSGLIVTGHTAKASYWQGQTASCDYMGPGKFAQ